jgi:hypothetical protein
MLQFKVQRGFLYTFVMNPCGLKRTIIAQFEMAAVRCHGNGPNSNRKEITEERNPREEYSSPERLLFYQAPPALPSNPMQVDLFV